MPDLRIKAVFFDAGNTLLRVHPSIGEVYARVARKFGVSIAPEEIEQSFKTLWNKTAPLVDNEGHRLTYEREKDWWKFLVRQVFEKHVAAMEFDDFFEDLFLHFAESECWRVYDDVPKTLLELQKRKYRLAIISNWDSRLPLLCEQLKLDHYFENCTVSALVGFEKPHPNIFKIALDSARLRPADVLYVGDDPFLDYQASRKAGMHSLHLDRSNRFPHHPHKIAGLDELIERLDSGDY